MNRLWLHYPQFTRPAFDFVLGHSVMVIAQISVSPKCVVYLSGVTRGGQVGASAPGRQELGAPK